MSAGLCPGQRSAGRPGEDQPGVPAQVPGGRELRELQTGLQDGLLLAKTQIPGDGETLKLNIYNPTKSTEESAIWKPEALSVSRCQHRCQQFI